jgi:hypothetical protein
MLESEVSPALAVDRSDRMTDDAYKKSGEEAERGMEEEASDPMEDEDPENESSSDSGGSVAGNGVDLLA